MINSHTFCTAATGLLDALEECLRIAATFAPMSDLGSRVCIFAANVLDVIASGIGRR